MSDQPPDAAKPAASSDSLPARLFGVIVSPRDTFARLVAQPKWFGAMALVTVLMAAGQFAFLSTPTGQEAMVDQQVHAAELRGNVTQAQLDMFDKLGPYNKFIVGGSILIFGPIVSFIMAGILFGVFNALAGGDASYKQVLAVLTHSGAVNVLQTLFVLPLNYLRASASSATNLGVFVTSFLDDGSFVARFLGMIDLFIIWGLIVTAIGLAVLYRRKTAPIFWSLMGVYVVIALVIAGVMRAFSGGA
jgi:Yip1 domain